MNELKNYIMINILANDGISKSGIDSLKKSVLILSQLMLLKTTKIVNKENISVILVRNATTVRKDLIDKCQV